MEERAGRPGVARLLAELCTELGLCLPPAARALLAQAPPPGIDAVLLAEGLDSQVVEKQLRRQVRERVARHLAVTD